MKSRLGKVVQLSASRDDRAGRRQGLRSGLCVLTAAFCLISAAALIFTTARTSAQAKSSCIDCHSTLEERLSLPTRLFEHDIHRTRGLSCTDCHGGDSTRGDKEGAKSPAYGYTGKPSPQQIPAFCGKCHSDAVLMKKFNPSLRVDQVQEYYTSVHGTRLKGGDVNVATCVSCHGIHGIRKPEDPQSGVYALNVAETCAKCHADGSHMAGYNIPIDQYPKYKNSVHARALYEKRDLSAPTCNDCHGNHGAVPPGLDSVANVCGQCHGRQAELFRKSPHKAPFERMQKGECIQCHSNHEIASPTDAMAGVGQGSLCITCHNNDKGFAAAQRIGSGMEQLDSRIRHAEQILDSAEQAGMEVSKPKFELRDANDALIQARVLVHTVSPDEVEGAIAPGMDIAAKSFESGEGAFAELSYRRKGLIVSLFFILFLAGLVYLKIRQIEGKTPFAKPA
jgi:predicted CXXCH cytochrome family protein